MKGYKSPHFQLHSCLRFFFSYLNHISICPGASLPNHSVVECAVLTQFIQNLHIFIFCFVHYWFGNVRYHQGNKGDARHAGPQQVLFCCRNGPRPVAMVYAPWSASRRLVPVLWSASLESVSGVAPCQDLGTSRHVVHVAQAYLEDYSPLLMRF